MTLNTLVKELEHLCNSSGEGFSCEESTEIVNEVEVLRSFLKHIDEKLFSANKETLNWWNFIKSLTAKFMMVYHELEKEDLISVSNKMIIKKCCDKLLSVGVLPCLSFSIKNSLPLISPEKLTDDQKNICIRFVVGVLVKLSENEFYRLIIVNRLGELLGGLFQILFYIRPSPPDREEFKLKLVNILDNYDQGIVIKSLMLLNCCQGDSAKLGRVVRQILVKKMMCEGGVGRMVSSVLNEGSSTNDVVKLSHLIAHKHPIDDYYPRVLPQILPLLRSKEERVREVGSQCFTLVYEKDESACEELLLRPLLLPLETASGEEKVEEALETINKLFDGNICRSAPLFVVKRICPALVVAYATVYGLQCRHKKLLSGLLIKCLENAKEDYSEILGNVLGPRLGVNFELGATGGLVTKERRFTVDLESWPKALHDLINTAPNLKGPFYASLLTSFGSLELEKRVVAAQLLTSLSEDADVLKSLSERPRPLIDFVTRLVSGDFDSDPDSVDLALAVLCIIASDKAMNAKRNWALFDGLIKPLKKVKKESTHGRLRVMADEVLSLLMTNGLSGLSLVGKIDLNEVRVREEKADCEKALDEARDPHLPVRAQALRRLGKLISSKDKTATKNRELILALIKEGMKDEDSYMYLSCIEALSCFASEFPNEVLDNLCDQFLHAATPELKLKVGEVLTKTCRKLGEKCFFYENDLIRTMLAGCQDEDPLVRASSLSNLGEICQILSFRVITYVAEIFDCIESIVDTDKELEPRRAAVMVVNLLFKGLGEGIFMVLGSILPSLYRKLKSIYYDDKDDVTKLHAQLALEELNSANLSLLFPQESYQNMVTILDS